MRVWKKAAHLEGFAGIRNCNATLPALEFLIRSVAHRNGAYTDVGSVSIYNDKECQVKPFVLTPILFFAVLGTVVAADGNSAANAQKLYQRDRAACLDGRTNQDRNTCLREAGAAFQEARRGRLGDNEAEFERNRLLRCDQQPAEDRPACIRRMNGEGITSGSVEGGGIYRELTVPVAAPGTN